LSTVDDFEESSEVTTSDSPAILANAYGATNFRGTTQSSCPQNSTYFANNNAAIDRISFAELPQNIQQKSLQQQEGDQPQRLIPEPGDRQRR